jgi:hypothetical protein
MEILQNEDDNTTFSSERHRRLCCSRAGSCGCGIACCPAVDPVFATIEAHRKAYALFDKAHKTYGMIRHGGFGLHPIFGRALQGEVKARLALLNTMPTTPAGVAAAMQHLGQVESFESSKSGTVSWVPLLDRQEAYFRTEFLGLSTPQEPESELSNTIATYHARLGEALAGMLATA